MDPLDKFGQTSGQGMSADQYFEQDPSEMFKFTNTPVTGQSAQAPSVGEGAAKGAAAGAAGGPWAAGAMAAMGALSAGLERQRAERQQEYLSKVNRLKAMQEATGNAQQMASRISYS